jgi:hypothetical protein
MLLAISVLQVDTLNSIILKGITMVNFAAYTNTSVTMSAFQVDTRGHVMPIDHATNTASECQPSPLFVLPVNPLPHRGLSITNTCLSVCK